MISIPRARELIGDHALSDEQVERIRDACHTLAELALDAVLPARAQEAGSDNHFIVEAKRDTMKPT